MDDVKKQNIEEEDEYIIDLRVLFCDLWKGFKKFWWIFLILSSLLAGLNYARSVVVYQPMYESKASFTVSTQMSYDEANTTYGFYYNQSTAEQLASLFPYVLKSDVMTGLIKEELGTDVLNGSVTASAIPNSNLFTIKAVSSDPDMAKQVLEATLKHIPDVTKYIIGETKLNMIQPVTTPEASYNKPNYRKQVVQGFLIGIVLSAVLLVLYAVFRKTIRKEEDFHDVLNMKCLGVIPKVKFKAHNKKIDTTISVLNSRTGRGFKESMRSLYMKIQRRTEEKGEKVFVITSTLPGEGKTTIAMNLALAMAERHKRVLLIDLDLRCPSLINRLEIPMKAARLSDVLRGKAEMEDGVQLTDQGIYFMGDDKSSGNISSMLTSDVLDRIIGGYRDTMDYIIIDAPPCEIITDAATISRVCDGILYVIEQDMAKQSRILDGIQAVSAGGAPILGGVLNGAETHLSGYGYGYYGYGYYGYGYKKYGYGHYGRYGSYGEKKEKHGDE